MSALYSACARVRQNSRWGWRLIENEGAGDATPRWSPVVELTTRRRPAMGPPQR
jgi:hypothetical protein